MIKGILFDKDGTLIDFFSLWLQAATAAIPAFLKLNNLDTSKALTDDLLQAIGVEDGEIDPKGALAYKSYDGIAEDICAALAKKGLVIPKEKARTQLENLFTSNVTNQDIQFQVFTDMKSLMEDLKSRNILIGLATADTEESARNCLSSLGIEYYFDYIGADNGKRKPKPDKEMFLEFAEMFSLRPEEIAVVGDTYNDMLFAKSNGGIAIAVLSGVSQKETFGNTADYILASIHELPGLLDQIPSSQKSVSKNAHPLFAPKSEYSEIDAKRGQALFTSMLSVMSPRPLP